MNTLQEFLNTVITTPKGYLELGIRNGTYKQEWYEWPNQLDEIVDLATLASNDGDVYFSAHLFSTKDSHKQNVLPSRTIQQDLDDADVSKLQLAPTILSNTSPHRHQGFWVLNTQLSIIELEELSRQVAYNIPLCDHSGWPLGHKMRLPFTKNYKYKDGPHPVQVVRVTGKRYQVVDLQQQLATHQQGNPEPNLSQDTLLEHQAFIEIPPTPPTQTGVQVYELVESVKDKLSSKVYGEYMQETPQMDRSSSLFSLETQLFRAGLSREEVYWVAYKSPNNKFHADLRFNADRELAKDVVRAERSVSSLPQNIKDMINLIRKQNKVAINERKKMISDIVLQAMRSMGDFINLEDERRYYIPRLSGRPMEVEAHTDQLHSLLDIEFGLNQTETEHQYVLRSLMSYTSTIPTSTKPAALSYFDKEERRLLLHSGRKAVYCIDQSGISVVDNGAHDVLFPWQLSWEPIIPNLQTTEYVDWGSILYTIPNVINMSPEEAKVILKVFTIFLLLREAITTKPLLAFLGQPGCLSETTRISVKHGTHHKEYTIKELYEKHYGLYKPRVQGLKGWHADNDSKTEVLNLKDGSIEYRPIDQIVKSGVKKTYLVMTKGARVVRTTKDHQFLTPEGYKPLSELKVGDTILVRKEPGLSHSDGRPARTYPLRTRVKAKYHPYGTKEVSNGKEYTPRIKYYRLVVEAALNGIIPEQFYYHINYHEDIAKKLKYLDSSMDVHHIDGDINNNELSNLEIVSHNEHPKRHTEIKHHFGYFAPIEDTVMAIGGELEEETYDITMEDQSAPNFVANNFIVHNSGKTSVASKMYLLLYGRRLAVSSPTTPVDYDVSTAAFPFYALDNVDTWEPWLPNRLALSARRSDVSVRKLYTNDQVILIKRQALVCVTAHDPKFGRADVTDRLLIIMLQRFTNMGIPFLDEQEMVDTIVRNRSLLWASIIRDIQRIFANPIPESTELQLRIQDFARLGEWIAMGLDCVDVFKEAIGSVVAAQRSFNLDEDHILISSIQRWLARSNYAPAAKTQDDLYREVTSQVTPEDIKTFQLLYKNSSTFCRRISTLQDTLNNTLFSVDMTGMDKKGNKLWLIRPKTVEQ